MEHINIEKYKHSDIRLEQTINEIIDRVNYLESLQNDAENEVKIEAKNNGDEQKAQDLENLVNANIDTLKQQYYEKFGKEVPNFAKNNVNWIKARLNK